MSAFLIVAIAWLVLILGLGIAGAYFGSREIPWQ